MIVVLICETYCSLSIVELKLQKSSYGLMEKRRLRETPLE